MVQAKIMITAKKQATILLPSLRKKAISINVCNSFVFDNVRIVEAENEESYLPFGYGLTLITRGFTPSQKVGFSRCTLDNITLSYNGLLIVFSYYQEKYPVRLFILNCTIKNIGLDGRSGDLIRHLSKSAKKLSDYEANVMVDVRYNVFEQVYLTTRQYQTPRRIIELQRLVFFIGHFDRFNFTDNVIKDC